MDATAFSGTQAMLVAVSVISLLIMAASLLFTFRTTASSKQKQLDDSEKLNALSVQLNQATMESRYHTAQAETLQQKLSEQLSHSENLSAELHKVQRANDVALNELEQKTTSLSEWRERFEQLNEELKQAREQLSIEQHKYADLDKRAKAFEVRVEESERQNQICQQQLRLIQDKFDEKLEQYNQLNTQHTRLKTELDERHSSHQKQVEQFEQQKSALSEQFKLLANDILDTKTKALQETNHLSLSSVMNPFKESIESFKKEVQEIHHRETSQQGELRKELSSLKELNQQITAEAHELSTALKGQKKLQGNWGELVLENVLDRSGLQLGKDYKREVSITTEDGRQRPDAIVYLPQDKHLIIDAKVSLNAYTRYINSEDELERKQALAEHVLVMGQRINELAKRDYYKLPGLNSPEIVFMFVPIESAFVEALKADETLFQKAIENNVLVATPTTLLTSLNIVRQLWRYEDQNKHTVALATKAETVFKKLNSFLSSFEGVKKGLDKANEAYVKAEGQLISGKGNLVKQVGEFKNLAPAIKAELPSYFTDKAELEIDYISSDSENAEGEET